MSQGNRCTLMAARTPADGKRGSQPAGVGIQLPQAPTPFGAYVEGVQSGDLLFLSGNAPCRKPEAKIRWAHRRGTGRRGRPGSGTRRGSQCLAVARLKLVVASGAFSKPWRPGWRMHFPARRRRASWPMVLSLQVPPEILVCFVEGLRVVGKTAPTWITSQTTVDALLDRFTR